MIASYAGLYRWFGHLAASPEAAADLTQATFAAFWASAGRKGPEVSSTTWLYAIGRNLAQAAATEAHAPGPLDRVANGGPSPEQRVQGRNLEAAAAGRRAAARPPRGVHAPLLEKFRVTRQVGRGARRPARPGTLAVLRGPSAPGPGIADGNRIGGKPWRNIMASLASCESDDRSRRRLTPCGDPRSAPPPTASWRRAWTPSPARAAHAGLRRRRPFTREWGRRRTGARRGQRVLSGRGTRRGRAVAGGQAAWTTSRR